MEEMYTGNKDAEAITRAEEEGFNLNLDPRGGGETGSQSESSRHQQERIYRTDSEGSSILGIGTTVTGGMLDHLIDDYTDQVALKQENIQRLSEEISRDSEEIKRLNFRIQELTSLREELRQQLPQKT